MSKAFLIALAFILGCAVRENINGLNCSAVRDGEFYIIDDGLQTTVTRTGNVQIERVSKGVVSRFRVQWLDSCRYRLTYLSGNAASDDARLRPVMVQIVEVKDSSYVVEGRVEGTAFGTARLELFKGKPRH